MISTSRTYRLARWQDAPTGEPVLAGALAVGWLSHWLCAPEHRLEVMEAYEWLAGGPGVGARWMDESEVRDYVRPRIERALATGELVLVDRLKVSGWKPSVEFIKEEEGAGAPASGAAAPVTATKTWIEFQVVDQSDKPVADVRYEARLTDDSIKKGKTDKDGLARFDDIDAGVCEFTLVDYDGDAVETLDESKRRPKKKTAVDVLLVDDDDQPISGARFVVELADGSKREGVTDEKGRGLVEDVEAGEHKVSFPEYDGGAWGPA